jgi:putative transposase
MIEMGCSVMLLLVRRLLDVLTLGPASYQRDIEIAVLGDQLAVLRRQVVRPRCSPTDGAALATLARLLSGERWGILVAPGALLRWHRDLVARSWLHRRRGRAATTAGDEEAVAVVLHLAGRTRAGVTSGPWAGAASSARSPWPT